LKEVLEKFLFCFGVTTKVSGFPLFIKQDFLILK